MDTVGAGRPLVVLHGNAPPASVEPIATALSGDHRVLLIHRPGYGGSRDEPARPAGAVGALLLEALEDAGVDRFDLCGHSYGAHVALRLATMAPERVRRLSLLSPLPVVAPDEVDVFRGAADALRAGHDLTEVLLARWIAPSFAAARPGLADTLRAWVDGDRAGLADDLVVTAEEPELPLADVRCPVLVRVGDLDQATPPAVAEALGARLADARIERVSGVGHLLALEDLGETARALRRFHGAPD